MSATRIDVPAGTKVYWEGYASPVGDTFENANGSERQIIETVRDGETGRLDAQYIVDRLASGLHFARVVA